MKITYQKPIRDSKGKLVNVITIHKKMSEKHIYKFERCGIKFTMFANKRHSKCQGDNYYYIVCKYPNETSKNYLCSIVYCDAIKKKLESLDYNFTKKEIFSFIDTLFKNYETKTGVEGLKKYIKTNYEVNI